jgi:heme-degrading monooxygenase HmoA
MIARIWRGVTREADKDTYFEYLQKTGLKEYASIPGHQGVWVLRRVDNGKSEFTLISLWDSWDAIKAFAGPEYENAVYYPADEKFLLERGPRDPLRSPVHPHALSLCGADTRVRGLGRCSCPVWGRVFDPSSRAQLALPQ